MSDQNVILFSNKTLGPYPLSSIFDPEVDGNDPNLAAGKIVPAVSSQVVDDIHGSKNRLYTVIAVDENTFKSTLIPTKIVTTAGDDERIVSYGNDVYMLYYISSTRRLIVDNKLTFFGAHGVKYQLVKINADGSTTVISKYASDPAEGADEVSTIDLEVSPVNQSKKCPDCYTDIDLIEKDQIYLFIYDETDTTVAVVSLVTKEASGVIDTTGKVVLSLDVTANQTDDAGNIILYLNQNKSDLVFTLTLQYSDSTSETIEVDNITTHMYGFENVKSSVANVMFPVLFKKYLPTSSLTVNYVSCLKYVKIVFSGAYGIAKLSPIPVWDDVTCTWSLKLLRYHSVRTTNPEYIVPTVTGFDPNKFDVEQSILLTTTHVNPSNVNEAYRQRILLNLISPRKLVFDGDTYTFTRGTGNTRVWTNTTTPGVVKTITYNINGQQWEQRTGTTLNYYMTRNVDDIHNPWDRSHKWRTAGSSQSSKHCNVTLHITTDPDAVNWTIAPSPNTNNIKYGDNVAPYIRPKIYYGTRAGSTGHVYFIPASLFGTSSTSGLNMTNNFYSNAAPPKLPLEAFPTVPTHFTIRDSVTLAVKLATPIAMANWNDDLPIAADSSYTNKTVIVEFLKYNTETSNYDIIYGVPVEVVSKSV